MDEYIDNEETQKYGPALRANVTRAFPDAKGPTATIVQLIVSGQKDADETMATAIARARATVAESSATAQDKNPLVRDTRQLLTGILGQLVSRVDLGEWSGNTELFFPGGRDAIGRRGASVLRSATVAREALEADETVPERAKLLARIKKAESSLETMLGVSGDANHEARSGLSEQSSEKAAWLREYRSNVLLTDALLVKAGREGERRSVIPHLAAQGGKKKGDGGGNTGEPTKG